MDTNEVTERIIGAAIRVHRSLGPGLLESTYEECLAMELTRLRLRFRRQVALPIRYEGRSLRFAYRLDLIVEDRVVVELKTVARIERVHLSQLLTYLKHSGCPVGLLFNFDVNVLTQEGLRRVVNNFQEPSAASPSSAVSALRASEPERQIEQEG